MATVKDIYNYIDSIAPFRLQMDFDNAGFLVGREEWNVNTVLVALDITEEVVLEAVQRGAQLIVAHHPVIFHPVKSVTDQDVTGRRLLSLVENHIAAICAHTNLDAAQGGVNECLARAIGLQELEQLHQDGVDDSGNPYGIGRVGAVKDSRSAREFCTFVKNALRASDVRFLDAGKTVRRVAVGGGSCGSMLRDALACGCDTFVTADVKYDVFLEAKALGINLLDAGHFATEDVVCQPLAEKIAAAFPGVNVFKSTVHKEVFEAL